MFNILSLETLQRDVPSIFSEGSAQRTSDKYQHISTINIIESLMSKGFMPTSAGQSLCRNEAKKAYSKHMIRFRSSDARPTASGLFPEIILIKLLERF